jgi:hypothetical protein
LELENASPQASLLNTIVRLREKLDRKNEVAADVSTFEIGLDCPDFRAERRASAHPPALIPSRSVPSS